MYRIGICDDDVAFCGQIEEYLFGCCSTIDIQTETLIFLSGTELLDYVDAEGPLDLLFLDIELTDTNGISIGKTLRSDIANEVTQIVFVSSQMNYALQLFQIRPLDFLLKPVKPVDIEKIIRIYIRLFVKNVNFFEYKSGRTFHQVDEKHIIFFQSEGRVVHITTTAGKESFYSKLSDVEKRLSSNVFVNVHKSFVINWNHVTEFHLNELVMSSGDIIPISQSRRSFVQERILKTNIVKKDL